MRREPTTYHNRLTPRTSMNCMSLPWRPSLRPVRILTWQSHAAQVSLQQPLRTASGHIAIFTWARAQLYWPNKIPAHMRRSPPSSASSHRQHTRSHFGFTSNIITRNITLTVSTHLRYDHYKYPHLLEPASTSSFCSSSTYHEISIPSNISN